MTSTYEEAYARGFHDAQDKARVEGRLVIVDSPELVALRARIEELEAENKRLRLEVWHANDVAEAAIENTRTAEAKLLEIAEAAFYEGFAEGCDGSWVEGDPSYAWKKSEVYTKMGKLK